jgi:hypothetical protein
VKIYIKQAPPPAPQDKTRLEASVRAMLADIAENRDAAVRRYARELDKWESGEFRVSADTIRKVEKSLPDSFKQDLKYSIKQVTGFAKKQLATLQSFETEMEPGIVLGQKMIPVERVGCYVPGGKFPLVASAIMSVGTAKTAGVSYVTACAPPRDAEGMYPYTLYALHAAGADEIYNLGGVQAMASMVHRRRQRVRRRIQTPAVRRGGHRSARRPDRDPDHRRRQRRRGAGRHGSARTGRARPGQPCVADHHFEKAGRGGAEGSGKAAPRLAHAQDRRTCLARPRRNRGGRIG